MASTVESPFLPSEGEMLILASCTALLPQLILLLKVSCFLSILIPFAYSNTGSPQQNPAASYSINKPNGGGLLFLQDTQLIETLAHFARERMPERFVQDSRPCF
jgi:hypothetical protein